MRPPAVLLRAPAPVQPTVHVQDRLQQSRPAVFDTATPHVHAPVMPCEDGICCGFHTNYCHAKGADPIRPILPLSTPATDATNDIISRAIHAIHGIFADYECPKSLNCPPYPGNHPANSDDPHCFLVSPHREATKSGGPVLSKQNHRF